MVESVIILISVMLGGWFVFDGMHVMLKGKYFGPSKPGPWSAVVKRVGIDPFSLGVPFIVLGVLWLSHAFLYVFGGLQDSKLTIFTTIVVTATLWYFPIGSLLSAIVLVLALL